jgi:hypothetical protein
MQSMEVRGRAEHLTGPAEKAFERRLQGRRQHDECSRALDIHGPKGSSSQEQYEEMRVVT